MRLVANALKQLERVVVVIETEWLLCAREINLLELFRQPDDRNAAKAKLFQFRARSVQLSFPAIDDDEVRHVRELVGRGVLTAPLGGLRTARPTLIKLRALLLVQFRP